MTDENRQRGTPQGRADCAERDAHTGTVGGSPSPPAPEPPETERGGSHCAQSTSRINEDEGARGDS